MSWSTSELRVRLAPWNWFKPSSKTYFYWPFQGGTSFVDHLCFLCLVFLMLLRLFIAALWSPAGKGLTSWLLLVMFIVFSLLSHEVSWVRCGTWLYCFLIFASFLTLSLSKVVSLIRCVTCLYRFLIFSTFLTLITRVVLSVLCGGPKSLPALSFNALIIPILRIACTITFHYSFPSAMFLTLHPMKSISLNSFALLKHLAVLMASTLAINC